MLNVCALCVTTGPTLVGDRGRDTPSRFTPHREWGKFEPFGITRRVVLLSWEALFRERMELDVFASYNKRLVVYYNLS